MHSSDSTSIMASRGLPFRNIISSVFILATVYLLYVYRGTENRLHESELTGSRCRRDADERVTELQELMKSKDELQERGENEKYELNTRIKSINQHYSMLQSQYKETEADFLKLKADMENMRLEQQQVEGQHAQEYQELKANRNKEIADLTEQVNTLKSQNEELQIGINSLRSQVQQGENAQKTLIDQNAKLQHQQYQQQKLLEQQPQIQQQPQQPQQQQQQGILGQPDKSNVGQKADTNLVQGGGNVETMKIEDTKAQVMAQQGVNQPVDVGNKAVNIDNINAQHQVAPPANPPDQFAQEEGNLNKGEERPAVNPNDLQKGQILEPMLDGEDKNKDGGEDKVHDGLAHWEKEEWEDKAIQGNIMEHQAPLALGQIQQPDSLVNQEAQGDGVGQQNPPFLPDQNRNDSPKGEIQAQAVNPVEPVAP